MSIIYQVLCPSSNYFMGNLFYIYNNPDYNLEEINLLLRHLNNPITVITLTTTIDENNIDKMMLPKYITSDFNTLNIKDN